MKIEIIEILGPIPLRFANDKVSTGLVMNCKGIKDPVIIYSLADCENKLHSIPDAIQEAFVFGAKFVWLFPEDHSYQEAAIKKEKP